MYVDNTNDIKSRFLHTVGFSIHEGNANYRREPLGGARVYPRF